MNSDQKEVLLEAISDLDSELKHADEEHRLRLADLRGRLSFIFHLLKCVRTSSREIPDPEKHPLVSLKELLALACQITGLRATDNIYTRNRTWAISSTRQLAMYLAVQVGYTTVITGAHFQRDHSTVTIACRAIKDRMDVDVSFRDAVQKALASLPKAKR